MECAFETNHLGLTVLTVPQLISHHTAYSHVRDLKIHDLDMVPA